MGPPIYIGGNFFPQADRFDILKSFNGATDLHRWKHDDFLSGINQIYKASMGPPIYIGGNTVEAEITGTEADKLQWGHRFTSVETRDLPTRREQRQRFNGATDLHRWKPIVRILTRQIGDASMGPPIYIGGNFLIALYEMPQILVSFNGATDLHRWKHRQMGRNALRASRFNGATDLHRWKP